MRDVLTTGTGQVAAALGMVVLYRLLALRTGTTGFASYALVRQTAWLAFPVVMVGIAGGLPRAIGIASDRAEDYLLAAVMITGTVTAAAAALMLGFPHQTAAVAFGDSRQTRLVGPFAATLAATTTYTLAYGYFRGRLAVRRAVVLQVGALAVAPVVAVVAFDHHPVVDLINLIAVLLGGMSAAAVLAPLARGVARTTRVALTGALRDLWIYGYRRVVGELAQTALIAAAPVVVARVDTAQSVAYIAAGQQLLVLLAFLTLPLGFVVLPTLGSLWVTDRPRGRWFGAQLASLGLHGALFISCQAYALGPLVIRIWLGPRFAGAEAVIHVTAIPAGAFACYLCIRSALDAVAVKSYNSRNNLIAVAVFASTTGILLGTSTIRPVLGVAWGLAAGLLTQGALAFATARKIFTIGWRELHLGVALPLSVVAGAVSLLVRPLIGASGPDLVLIVVLEFAMLGLYLLGLVRAGVQWPRTLVRRTPVLPAAASDHRPEHASPGDGQIT